MDVQLSGTYTVVNHSFKTRIRLPNENHSQPLVCMRSATNQPAVDMEQWEVASCEGSYHTFYNAKFSSYVSSMFPVQPDTEVIRDSGPRWWILEDLSHKYGPGAYAIRPPSHPHLCWSLTDGEDQTPVCLREYTSTARNIWKIVQVPGTAEPRPDGASSPIREPSSASSGSCTSGDDMSTPPPYSESCKGEPGSPDSPLPKAIPRSKSAPIPDDPPFKNAHVNPNSRRSSLDGQKPVVSCSAPLDDTYPKAHAIAQPTSLPSHNIPSTRISRARRGKPRADLRIFPPGNSQNELGNAYPNPEAKYQRITPNKVDWNASRLEDRCDSVGSPYGTFNGWEHALEDRYVPDGAQNVTSREAFNRTRNIMIHNGTTPTKSPHDSVPISAQEIAGRKLSASGVTLTFTNYGDAVVQVVEQKTSRMWQVAPGSRVPVRFEANLPLLLTFVMGQRTEMRGNRYTRDEEVDVHKFFK